MFYYGRQRSLCDGEVGSDKYVQHGIQVCQCTVKYAFHHTPACIIHLKTTREILNVAIKITVFLRTRNVWVKCVLAVLALTVVHSKVNIEAAPNLG